MSYTSNSRFKVKWPGPSLALNQLAKKTIFSASWLMLLLAMMLVAGPTADWVHVHTTPPGTPLYVELPTPVPTTLNPIHERVLAAQMDRQSQYRYLQSVMNDWDLDCFDQARQRLKSYQNQPQAFDRYVASLWMCAYTGHLD